MCLAVYQELANGTTLPESAWADAGHARAPAGSVAMAGHSIGELSALYGAGCMSFRDGVRLARARGLAMQAAADMQAGTAGEAAPWAMAACLGPNAEQAQAAVEASCTTKDQVQVAAVNGPTNITLSGTAVGLAAAVDHMKASGVRCRAMPLSVSAPFHSVYMQPVAAVLARILGVHDGAVEPTKLEGALEAKLPAGWDAPVRLHEARIPVVPCVDPARVTTHAGDLARALVVQTARTVQWLDVVHKLDALTRGGDTAAHVEYIGMGYAQSMAAMLKCSTAAPVVRLVYDADTIRQITSQ